jgi:hypothetical protein
LDAAEVAKYPEADVTIERIGALMDLDLPMLLKSAGVR